MQMTATSPQVSDTRGAALRLDGVQINFGEFTAVTDIDVAVEAGEFVCLLGPSGCGKSTLITALAGFVPATAGQVTVDGRAVKGPSLDTGMVFQSTEALFDWLTVRHNVEYGPKMRGIGRAERRAISDRFLDLVGLAHCADRLPEQLSGGMRQRAQIARVLANEPRVVLMDEPFGALDAMTRQVMQQELARIVTADERTVFLITHSIDEALILADRIFVLSRRPGRLKCEVDNDLPRPRDDDVLLSEKYTRIKAQIWESVRDEVMPPPTGDVSANGAGNGSGRGDRWPAEMRPGG